MDRDTSEASWIRSRIKGMVSEGSPDPKFPRQIEAAHRTVSSEERKCGRMCSLASLMENRCLFKPNSPMMRRESGLLFNGALGAMSWIHLELRFSMSSGLLWERMDEKH